MEIMVKTNNMSTFEDYMNELLRRSGIEKGDFIGDWPESDVGIITQRFSGLSDKIRERQLTVQFRKDTNQSHGNDIANYFIEYIGCDQDLGIRKLRGSGYPDCIVYINNKKIAAEIKSTSKFDVKNSQRRVLLSSLKKLEKSIKSEKIDNPPCHLLITLIYSYSNDKRSAHINKIRLDFLNKKSAVNVRFEAYLTHQSLSKNQNKENHVTVF